MPEKTILIVDDEHQVVNLMELVFTRNGYQVRTAASGKEALQILSDQDIPVMFFDLNMPDMDGRELCRKIRQRRPAAFIVAVTGMGPEDVADDCRAAGFDDILSKPINLKLLEQAASRAFEGRTPGGASPGNQI